MLQPDMVLQGRYQIVRLIGQGGMGAVYEARDLRLGSSLVALKQALFDTNQLRQAFEREAILLASLSHPNLPKVRDQFADAHGQFLVMEFIAGPDLSKLLQERGTALPLDEAANYADQLLDALEYIHEHQPPVIHRDIKPENIKLTARGQVMLIDFGLAKDLGGVSVIAYSAAYAPLEQLRAKGTDARSDLYALGATLYRLMTGRLPANAVERLEAYANTGNDPLRLPHDLSLAISEAVGRVIMRALELDRENRFQSAREMRQALRRAVASSPQPSRQASPISDLPTVITPSRVPSAGQNTAPPRREDSRAQRSGPPQAPPQPLPPPVQSQGAGWNPTSGAQWGGSQGQPPYYNSPPMMPGAPAKRKNTGLIILLIIIALFMFSCGFLGFIGMLVEE